MRNANTFYVKKVIGHFLFLFLFCSNANCQNLILICKGISTKFSINEKVTPYTRTVLGQIPETRTYSFKHGIVSIVGFAPCRFNDETIYCERNTKDNLNPSITRNHFITINRLSGKIIEEDYTMAGFGTEWIYEGNCSKGTLKF